ncbi:hypothetical protein BDV59DRAFT_131800 [Aspergillus ambiguus]|uniref:uncharacterized protein n=1 Tax=Aspergillus ambiguus TaxID=176160 RepID=UPI003CCDCAA3
MHWRAPPPLSMATTPSMAEGGSRCGSTSDVGGILLMLLMLGALNIIVGCNHDCLLTLWSVYSRGSMRFAPRVGRRGGTNTAGGSVYKESQASPKACVIHPIRDVRISPIRRESIRMSFHILPSLPYRTAGRSLVQQTNHHGISLFF